MRVILDITKTPEGRFEGTVSVSTAAGQWQFAGILELLAILEGVLDDGELPRPGAAGYGAAAEAETPNDGVPQGT